MNLRKTKFSVISILAFFLSFGYLQGYGLSLPKLIVFHSPACHRCIQVKKELIPKIEREFKAKIEIEYRDISDIENYKLMLGLKEKYQSGIEISLPVFFMEGKFLNGKGEIENNLKILITNSLISFGGLKKPPAIDLLTYFRAFTPLAIISAGLIDGINPCAFTVIVFFISFLALQGYRKRELITIGLAFIFAVFLTYLLMGIGIFNFLYQLKGFWLITKIFNISVGVFSILLGTLAVYDFFKFKKTKDTEGLLLQLPKAIKNRIHYVVAWNYRKTRESVLKERAGQRHIFILLITALSCGFLVSILEAVCTGQAYLPTITFILKTSHLRLQALGYLLLYNLMFVLPLFIIFLFAILGATSGEFSDFLKKRLLAIKLLMAMLFFGLGIFLICSA